MRAWRSAAPGLTACFVALSGLASAQQAPKDAPVVHVVLFTLGEGAAPEQADELVADSKRLLEDIPGVDVVWAGRKAVADREVHVKDYDVALCVRLAKRSDLASYAAHPKHRELVEKWRSRASWRVIDFYAE